MINKQLALTYLYLSSMFSSDRFLPDKAIDLIDEVGPRVHLHHAQLPEEARELEKHVRQIIKEKNEVVRSQEFEKLFPAKSYSQD